MDPPEPASGSCYLTRATALEAIELVQPVLERIADNVNVSQSGVVYVVILDPACSPVESRFEHAILYEGAFGRDSSTWDADYGRFAREKARLSWRTGCDSHVVLQLQPQRLRSGDVRTWGSVVLDGIVVAVSGAEPAYDEALAGMVAMLLRGLAKASHARTSGG